MHLFSNPARAAAPILLVGLAASNVGAAPPRYVSPNGFSVNIMSGFVRDRRPQKPGVEAAWNGPRRATMSLGTVPIPASVTGPQLLQMAKEAYPKSYGKKARIVHAETMTVNGNRGAVVEGRVMSNLKPIIPTHTIQFSLARGSKLYIFSLAVNANEADSAGTRFSNMLKTLKFRP